MENMCPDLDERKLPAKAFVAHRARLDPQQMRDFARVQQAQSVIGTQIALADESMFHCQYIGVCPSATFAKSRNEPT